MKLKKSMYPCIMLQHIWMQMISSIMSCMLYLNRKGDFKGYKRLHDNSGAVLSRQTKHRVSHVEVILWSVYYFRMTKKSLGYKNDSKTCSKLRKVLLHSGLMPILPALDLLLSRYDAIVASVKIILNIFTQ